MTLLASDVAVSGSAEREQAPALLELRGATRHRRRWAAPLSRLACRIGLRAPAPPRPCVDGVDLMLHAGESVGVIGPAGCGKTPLAHLAAGTLALSAGERRWGGRVAASASRVEGAPHCAVQLLPTACAATLDARLRVQDIVGKAPVSRGVIGRRQQVEYVGLHLNRVGLDPTLMRERPDRLSPGQRVRVAVARALALTPELLVCDDPLRDLDPTVRAPLLNLFLDLRTLPGLSLLFLGRDPGAIAHLADRIAVMYGGCIVETGPADALLAAPGHPYTRVLLARSREVSSGQRMTVATIPTAAPMRPLGTGCVFYGRCPHAMAVCRDEAPPWVGFAPQRRAACHLEITPA